MPDDLPSELQPHLDRLLAGDDGARQPLLECFARRLQALVNKMVRESFPALAGHEDTAFQESALKLWKALQAVHPPTAADFCRFAAHKVRQALLDEIAHRSLAFSRLPHEGQSTHDPARLAEWTEFHERVEQLPAAEQEVFVLRFYDGLTNAQIAQLQGKHPKVVSRLWIAATERLLDATPGWRHGFEA